MNRQEILKNGWKNLAVLDIMKRIGDQSDLKTAWELIPNAERNYLAGDLYNIIDRWSKNDKTLCYSSSGVKKQ